jgi:hypothetical protein
MILQPEDPRRAVPFWDLNPTDPMGLEDRVTIQLCG